MNPGDVVIAAFPGAHLTKTRPAVVLSTDEYHRQRPDVIIGLITTQTERADCPTDSRIEDWVAAGLHAPSCFRLYIATLPQASVRVTGRLSDRDWVAVRRRVRLGIAVKG